MKQVNELSPTKSVASKTLYEAFKILKSEGGELPGREIFDRIRKQLQFNEWEKDIYPNTGYVRWESMLHFFSVDCVKAGYLRKIKGVWYLTPEGEVAMKNGPIELLDSASAGYKKWKAASKAGQDITPGNESVDVTVGQSQTQKAKLDQLVEQAIDGLKQYIIQKNPYEFQDLIAALLRAMGYYTPFISPKGKDGGIDIIAYQDPLGIQKPRIKVQIKHYPQNPIAAESVRSLKGLVNNNEEVGLYVTSGRFTNEAQKFAKEANIHIKLIDGEELILLWQQYYNEMNDEDKSLLPLHPIYFLGSNE